LSIQIGHSKPYLAISNTKGEIFLKIPNTVLIVRDKILLVNSKTNICYRVDLYLFIIHLINHEVIHCVLDKILPITSDLYDNINKFVEHDFFNSLERVS